MPMRNALTVDVEDWFHGNDFNLTADQRALQPSRVVENTRRLLKLFAAFGSKGTFFVLGEVAEQFSELVREIAAEGHELGAHAHTHSLLFQLDPEACRDEINRSLSLVSAAANRRVTLFRAPTWSINNRNMMTLSWLVDSGVELDSSVYPCRTPFFGVANWPRHPHKLRTQDGRTMTEFPPMAYGPSGYGIPVCGGFFLRLLPVQFSSYCLHAANRKGLPGLLYVHPWEVDPEQPRMGLPFWQTAPHYWRLGRTEGVLRYLCKRHPFVPLSEAADQLSGLSTYEIPSR